MIAPRSTHVVFPVRESMKKKEVQTYVYTSSYFMFMGFIARSIKRCQQRGITGKHTMLDKTANTKQNLVCCSY